MDFTVLKKTDCSKYIEKKGNFSYLSWPYMVDQLRTHLPEATIQARKNDKGMPYFIDNGGAMVETYITEGETELWSEWLPVMDFKNKAISTPDSMDINKAIQRCKAKCISEYLGIGLYIYMGEDLPEAEVLPPKVVTMGHENVSWMVGFCKRHEITSKEVKKEFMEKYEFSPHSTTAEEFSVIKAQIEADFNEV